MNFTPMLNCKLSSDTGNRSNRVSCEIKAQNRYPLSEDKMSKIRQLSRIKRNLRYLFCNK